jgi:hypothetical protein
MRQEQRIAAESAPKPEARISAPMRKPTDPMLVGARGMVEDEKAAKQKAINDEILAPMRAERAAKEQAEAANKAQIAERSTTRSLLRDNDKMTGAASGAAVLDSALRSTLMDKAATLKNIGDSSEAMLANRSALDDIDMGLADNTDFGGSSSDVGFDKSQKERAQSKLERQGVLNTSYQDRMIAGNVSGEDIAKTVGGAVDRIASTGSNLLQSVRDTVKRTNQWSRRTSDRLAQR